MNIGLYPVDSKMANLALMKISSYHKSIGDSVTLFYQLWKFDRVYVSKIFNFSPMPFDILTEDVVYGGTGYDIEKELSPEIESQEPDYTIYYNCFHSIQLFSRGCIRHCPFCGVERVIMEREIIGYCIICNEEIYKDEAISLFNNREVHNDCLERTEKR